MSSSSDSVYQAPAKINLSLKIDDRKRRTDGYHEISTLIAKIDLADELHFHKSITSSLVCDAPDLAVDESNLVLRAVQEFEKVYGRKVKQKITLTKRVPMAAGLGGGSADAAVTLLALNERLGTQYTHDELREMAAAIGSDVAFFINPVVTLCKGRGERTKTIERFSTWSSPIVLLKPQFGVSTKWAYGAYRGAHRRKEFFYGEQELENGPRLVNDLEIPVFSKFPFLGLLKNWMLERPGVKGALMSGSGSTMFALTDTPESARKLAEDALAEIDPTLYTYCGVANPQ